MKSINIGKGSGCTTVDVRDWPAGVYFVRYRDIEGRSRWRGWWWSKGCMVVLFT
ncbi:MAG: hypothetical protein IPL25_13695 [Saprospiraceae bacterium]|nr:hypothetical protein [Candidatus Vicinibacter affinis]